MVLGVGWALGMAGVATGSAAASPACWTSRGAAVNSSSAAVSRFLAASCGSRSPGSAGVLIPLSRDVASTTIAPARISQATQPMRVIAATARVPSSGLVSA